MAAAATGALCALLVVTQRRHATRHRRPGCPGRLGSRSCTTSWDVTGSPSAVQASSESRGAVVQSGDPAHTGFRGSIRDRVASRSHRRTSAQASHGQEAIQRCRSHLPRSMSMDLQTSGKSALDAIGVIRGRLPEDRIIGEPCRHQDVARQRAIASAPVSMSSWPSRFRSMRSWPPPRHRGPGTGAPPARR